MAAPNCVFCKIVAGKIPCLRVYEDPSVLAFLDIGPLAEGHLLVIPKDHAERLEDMPTDILAHLVRQLPPLARAVLKVTATDSYNLLQNNGKTSGQEVPHVHFHIIPRKAADGLGYRWLASSYPAGRGEEIRRQLVAALA
ncbi:MAG: HIT family protein [Planctomycetes bacterium]|nr:HIT family protein [Planctomycetota bacterium]